MADFGRSLLKSRFRSEKKKSCRRSQEISKSSVTERSDLDEFIAVAEMSNKSFAEGTEPSAIPDFESFRPWLRLPRRPPWSASTTPEELQQDEQSSFLEWRRSLSTYCYSWTLSFRIEHNHNFVLTPFERNLEIWRQLWRVVEASDVIIQIVDARNPLLFFCEDLFTYSKETCRSKTNILLLNKADLLSSDQMFVGVLLICRLRWKGYFESRSVECYFFSALSADSSGESGPVIAANQLINILSTKGKTIGLVGYPNVGKSSTINSILRQKRTSVSSTPGKTKHLQSFILDNGIKLYDCPGLVFPNMASTKSELVLNGILPIDQLRDCISPVEMLLCYIPPLQIEMLYRVKVDGAAEEKTSRAHAVLSALAASRGFRTSVYGNPDVSRAARIILKDYVNARLLYCHKPPPAA